MQTEPLTLNLFDSIHKKRSRLTIRVKSDKRATKKTINATFANFIHQKDAFIAMVMIYLNKNKAIYTVHDNFICNPITATHMTKLYL